MKEQADSKQHEYYNDGYFNNVNEDAHSGTVQLDGLRLIYLFAVSGPSPSIEPDRSDAKDVV